MNPYTLLREAIKAVPAVKYALGVAGVAAVVAIVLGLHLNPEVAIFGTIIVFGLMVVLLAFSRYAGQANTGFVGPVVVLLWFYTVALIVTTTLFITSYFVHWPLTFAASVGGSLSPYRAAQSTTLRANNVSKAQEIPPDIREKLVSQLLERQPQNGDSYKGFDPFSVENQGISDAWIAAQSLIALISSKEITEPFRQRVMDAFRFIESVRYPADPDRLWLSPREASTHTRTDVAGWVAVAYLKSIGSDDEIWHVAEIDPVIKRVTDILERVASRQNAQTGAWGPTKNRSDTNDRTYPTVISLWALVEAKRTKLVRDQVQGRYDAAINSGVEWILQNYHSPFGWYPKPTLMAESCDGLSSLTLFTLTRAEHLSGVRTFSEDETYKQIKQDFLNNLHDRQPTSLCRPATGVLTEGNEVYYVSFPPYAWALASARILMQDPDLASSDRKKASELYADLVSASLSLVHGFPRGVATFQIAETMIGMFYRD